MSPGAAVGRDALIKAACELLQIMPPARVTRAEVARHAGVDPALIRYYFQDRASLLRAVVEHVTSNQTVKFERGAEGDAESRIRAGAETFLAFMVANPFFHRLVLEELAGSDSDEAREIFGIINANSIARHKAILDDGAAKGELKPANPLLVHIAQIGMCEFFVAARPIIEEALGPDVDMDALTAEYSKLVGDMIVGGLKVQHT